MLTLSTLNTIQKNIFNIAFNSGKLKMNIYDYCCYRIFINVGCDPGKLLYRRIYGYTYNNSKQLKQLKEK